jgi:hypothetical protein
VANQFETELFAKLGPPAADSAAAARRRIWSLALNLTPARRLLEEFLENGRKSFKRPNRLLAETATIRGQQNGGRANLGDSGRLEQVLAPVRHRLDLAIRLPYALDNPPSVLGPPIS